MEPVTKVFEQPDTSEIVSLSKLRKLIIISLFSCISFVLMTLLEIPLIPSFSMLKYDASEIPALLLGFSMGTSAGIYVILFKSFMYLFFSGKGFYDLGLGTFMSIAAGITLVFVSTKIYFLKPTKRFAIIGLLAGTIVMTLVMVPLNYLALGVLPLLFPNLGELVSYKNAIIYISLGVLPFNLLKGLFTSSFTFFIYKKISSFLKETGKLLD